MNKSFAEKKKPEQVYLSIPLLADININLNLKYQANAQSLKM